VHQIASHRRHAGILKTLLEFNVGADVSFSRFLELAARYGTWNPGGCICYGRLV
jgi:hypothetical protein